MSQKKVIVIGAGYGGMAIANLLGKAGYSVVVLEKNDEPGGRIAVIKKDGYVFDIGPSWYLMPEVFEQYYSLFDASANERLELIRFTPGYKVFFDDKPEVFIQGDVGKDKAVFEAIEPGAGKKLEDYVRRSSIAYHLAVKQFLYNNFSSPKDLVSWQVIKNAHRMIPLALGNLDRYVSRYFKDQRLKQLLEYHMVFLGSSPFQAPAIYTLMSHLDFISGVYYPKRGMLSLVDDMKALGTEYDITYRCATSVKRIVTNDGLSTGVELENGEIIDADIVVSNADLYHTETKLLDETARSFGESYWKKRQPGPGALLVSLGIKGVLPELVHHNLYFVDDWRGNFKAIYEDQSVPSAPSMYVCNPTKTDPFLAPDGNENVFILIPLPAGVSLDDKQEEDIANKAVAQFSKVSGIGDLESRIVTKHIFGPDDFKDRFNAWDYNAFGGESHLLRQSIFMRTPNQSKKIKNLYYVGAGTLPGIGLPMCLIGAELTYKKIVGDRSPGPVQRIES